MRDAAKGSMTNASARAMAGTAHDTTLSSTSVLLRCCHRAFGGFQRDIINEGLARAGPHRTLRGLRKRSPPMQQKYGEQPRLREGLYRLHEEKSLP